MGGASSLCKPRGRAISWRLRWDVPAAGPWLVSHLPSLRLSAQLPIPHFPAAQTFSSRVHFSPFPRPLRWCGPVVPPTWTPCCTTTTALSHCAFCSLIRLLNVGHSARRDPQHRCPAALPTLNSSISLDTSCGPSLLPSLHVCILGPNPSYHII